MFTGIVEELGTVRRVLPGARAGKIVIAASKVLEDVHLGDSIAVNGVCLTVVSFTESEFTADVMPETLRKSGLGKLKAGDAVDLERAMAANGRFGGHIVSGHIDGTGIIKETKREENAVVVSISAPQHILNLVVEKGSIAIDGISLTVASVTSTTFSVSLIPHTGEQTVLLKKRVGDVVNLENDIVGKYVQKLLMQDGQRGVQMAEHAADQAAGQASGQATQAFQVSGNSASYVPGRKPTKNTPQASNLSLEFLQLSGF